MLTGDAAKFRNDLTLASVKEASWTQIVPAASGLTGPARGVPGASPTATELHCGGRTANPGSARELDLPISARARIELVADGRTLCDHAVRALAPTRFYNLQG